MHGKTIATSWNRVNYFSLLIVLMFLLCSMLSTTLLYSISPEVRPLLMTVPHIYFCFACGLIEVWSISSAQLWDDLRQFLWLDSHRSEDGQSIDGLQWLVIANPQINPLTRSPPPLMYARSCMTHSIVNLRESAPPPWILLIGWPRRNNWSKGQSVFNKL